ncbi:MAG: CusA/CzcA family heavy metal efflux RND transporter [Bryobacterales bacterium]|nr:CusA/CzcA family heavy metal efflux RND transporter [Bryobacterales bacterium]
MLARVVDWSLENRLLVLVVSSALAAAGFNSIGSMPLDALPDLSDVQVVVYTKHPGQSPRIVEDQITYPLTTQMLAVPYAETVRGYSFFGFSLVYVLFEDGTDLYWARSRVLETLGQVAAMLPEGASPTLGPDATGVGWAYIYALKSDRHDLSQLRSLQDWFLRFELTGIPGVAEVATVGGFVRQYQIAIDPLKLRAYGIPISRIKEAVQSSNRDVGGRLIELAEKEFMIRGRGYIESIDDIRKVSLGTDRNGTPVLLRDVARIEVGPEIRRGLAEWDGQGETVGAIVIIRHGADTREVVRRVTSRLEELKPQLPEGVSIEVAYDRTALIDRVVDSLRSSLTQQFAIVGVVCLLFLFHVLSGIVAVLTIVVGVLVAGIAAALLGVHLDIMSLGGVAVAVGTMVDAGIVMVENAHQHMARDGGRKPRREILRDSCRQIAPTLFFSLLIITVSFLPVFALQEEEGRLFRPLAWTKTLVMASAALLSVTLVPVLVSLAVRKSRQASRRNPVRTLLVWFYRPVLGLAMRHRVATLVVAVAVLGGSISAYRRLGSEFMPPLWEGDLLYMPTTLPGVSIAKARELVQQTNKIIMTFPEVEHVFGKAGRADTATDPAPLSMIESTIRLKPPDQWRPGMTPERLVSELQEAVQVPGLTNAWTMPIRTRLDMLATGIKTPVGIKIAGPDLEVLERLGREIERVMRGTPGTLSAFSERVMGGNYLDINIDRETIARHGLVVDEVQEAIRTALGGVQVGTTVEGLQRFPVNLRYSRNLRADMPALRDVLVTTPTGHHLPLSQLADLEYSSGPSAIKSENARPNAWVYVDVAPEFNLGDYLASAREAVDRSVTMPPGYSLAWSGQFESIQRVEDRLRLLVPLTLVIVFSVLLVSTGSALTSAFVLAGIPLALSGSFMTLAILDYNLSIAVWVGLIAVAGLYAETAIVFWKYLDVARQDHRRRGILEGPLDLVEAIRQAAVARVRPIAMTVATDMLGLVPVMWSTGAGADVMKRIATPLFGGVATSAFVVLVIFPVLYYYRNVRSLNGPDSLGAPGALKEVTS